MKGIKIEMWRKIGRISRIIYLLVIIFFPVFYFFMIQAQEVLDEDIISKIDKQFSFISWSVTAITSILAFGVLYLTILLDKYLFNNIKLTKEFYKPYHISKKELKNYIYGNSNLQWKSGLLYFYSIFSLSTFFINLFWATCIGYYSNYTIFSLKEIISFKWLGDINTLSDILAIFVPLTFWIIISAINILVYGILIENRFLIKIKIPSKLERLDINFLKSQEADLGELLFKSGPLLTIYNKYENGIKGIDLCIEQEIPWRNYCVVFKFYQEDKIKYKLYYRSSDNGSDNPKPVSLYVDIDDKEEFFKYLNEDTNIADVSFFTLEGEEISSFKLSLDINTDQKVFMPFRQILHIGKNIEQGRLKIMNNQFDLEKLDSE